MMSRKMTSVLVVFLALFLITVPAWSANPGANTGPNGPGEDCTPVGDGPFGPSQNGPIGPGPAPTPGPGQGFGFGFGFGHDDGSDPSPNGPNGPAGCDSGHL